MTEIPLSPRTEAAQTCPHSHAEKVASGQRPVPDRSWGWEGTGGVDGLKGACVRSMESKDNVTILSCGRTPVVSPACCPARGALGGAEWRLSKPRKAGF